MVSLVSQKDQEKTKNFRKLLELHWNHCKHIENERAQFMSIYAVITGAVLAFMAQKGFESLWPLYFLIVLTFFGFFHTVRWIHAFEYHRERVNFLIEELTNKYGPPIDLTMDIPAIELGRLKKLFRTRYWFPLFYIIILSGLLFAILSQERSLWGIVVVVAATVLILFTGLILSLRDIKEKLKNLKEKKDKASKEQNNEKRIKTNEGQCNEKNNS